MIRFRYTIAYVPDPAAAVEFYEAAFGLERRFLSEEGDYGELVTDGVTLAFASHDLGAGNIQGGFQALDTERPAAIEIGFVTEDVAEAMEQAVAAGAVLLTEPRVKPWGQTVAWVRDPFGLVVEIATSMDG